MASEKRVEQSAEETSPAASINLTTTDQEAQGWDKIATKRLLWRLDSHIIPFMSLIYLSVPSLTYLPSPTHLPMY